MMEMNSRMYSYLYSPMFDGVEPMAKTPNRPTFLSPSTLLASSKRFNHEDYLSNSQPLDLSSRKLDEFFSPQRYNSGACTPMMQMPYISPIPNFSPKVTPYKMLSSGTVKDSINDSIYLKRLHRNPMFSELQSLLAQECLHMQVPTNLINSSWSTTPSMSKTVDNINNVFPRHMKLQEKFIQLRSKEEYRHDGLRLESEYSAEVGQLEVARYQALCAAGNLDQHRKSVNDHFDKSRLQLLQRYECELEKVTIKKTANVSEKINFLDDKDVINSGKTGFNSAAIAANMAYNHGGHREMKTVTVARQLNFPSEVTFETSKKMSSPTLDSEFDIPSCASSPEFLQIDLSQTSEESEDSSIKGTLSNLGDSGVCEDTFSEHSDSGIDILRHVSELSGIKTHDKLPPLTEQHKSALKSAGLELFDTTRHQKIYDQGIKFNSQDEDFGYSLEVCSDDKETYTDVEPAPLKRKSEYSDECNDDQDSKRLCKETTAIFRGNSRQLNATQTEILTTWYNEHIRYPYPSDLEVQQLSELTDLKPKQIKKWMANKRVRCFNTLSISGNQHPIKFKFKGKRQIDNGQNKPTYQQLDPEARKHLSDWYDTHAHYPYPTDEEKEMLAKQAGISVAQVKSWFANKRSRTNNTRRQVPNYFINKYPEYTPQVQMISLSREIARKSKRQFFDTTPDYLYRF